MKSRQNPESYIFLSVSAVSNRFGISKQTYYKRMKQTESHLAIDDKIIEEVLKIRKRMPRLGTRKLHQMLVKEDSNLMKKTGRDKLFGLLSSRSLLVKKKKRTCRTTNSNHLYKKYTNLIKDLKDIKPLEVLVTDITYIPMTRGKFSYLSLVTDYGSRNILGWYLSSDLSHEGPLKAIKKAEKSHDIKGSIHHSDRGIQYCCHNYINYLVSKDVKISMTEKDHVYENALAERVNGILKDEFLIDLGFSSMQEANKAIGESIKIYNEERLHLSLSYRTPHEVITSYIRQGKEICG